MGRITARGTALIDSHGRGAGTMRPVNGLCNREAHGPMKIVASCDDWRRNHHPPTAFLRI